MLWILVFDILLNKTQKEKDERRLKALKECGYKVLYVEQNDYEANELKTINDCVSFINANYEERRKRYI